MKQPNRKLTFKERMFKKMVIIDIFCYKIAERFFLKRVKKKNKHKYRIYSDHITGIEAQALFWGTVVLPVVLAPAEKRPVEITTSVIFLLMFGLFVYYRYTRNKELIKTYDEVWKLRHDEAMQKKAREMCYVTLVYGAGHRVPLIVMHLLLWLSYDLLLLPVAVAVPYDIPMILGMNVYFFGFILYYYIDHIYDLGSGGTKEKAKEKKRLTALQQQTWERLVGSIKPAPMPTN